MDNNDEEAFKLEVINNVREIIISGYANGYLVEFSPKRRQLHLPNNIRPFYWRVDKTVKIERIEFGPPEDATGPLSLRLKFHNLHNVNIRYGEGGYNYIEASPVC